MDTMTPDQIEEYFRFELELWGKTWTSNDGKTTRFYLDQDAVYTLIGLEVDHYKSGSISSALLDGEKISNNAAQKLSTGKWWIQNGKLNGNNDVNPEMLQKATAKLAEMTTQNTQEEETVATNTATEYATYQNIVGDITVETTITAVLGDENQNADIIRIAGTYRQAINEALPAGVTLNGNTFFGPADYGFDRSEIFALIDEINIGHIASIIQTSWTSFEDAHNYVIDTLGQPGDGFIYNTEYITRQLTAVVQNSIDEGTLFDGQDLAGILEEIPLSIFAQRGRIHLAEGCDAHITQMPTLNQRARYEVTCSCGHSFETWFPWVNHGRCLECAAEQARMSDTLASLIDPTRHAL